ncbi:MAG: hypothetical protein ACXWIU_03735 [Limisphaerales bacterium]
MMHGYFMLSGLLVFLLAPQAAAPQGKPSNFKPQVAGVQDSLGQTWVATPANPSQLSLTCSPHAQNVRPWPSANGPEISQANCVPMPSGTVIVPPMPAQQPANGNPMNPTNMPNIMPFNQANNGGYGKGGNYDGGEPYGSSGYSPKRMSPADLKSAMESMRTDGLQPACGAGESGTDMWQSTANVMDKGIIPPGQGKDVHAPNRARLISRDGELVVEFGPNKVSHCSSAIMTAFYQHIADLVNSKPPQMTLTGDQIRFLNGPIVTNALYGNTAAYAILNQAMGGQSMWGKNPSEMTKVLENARPGDILKFDRRNGQGHQTVFKSFDGNKVCFWSSNQANGGVGVNCEELSTLSDVVVSRFPTDINAIPARLDKMKNSSAISSYFATANVDIPIEAIPNAQSLTCEKNASTPAAGTTTNR